MLYPKIMIKLFSPLFILMVITNCSNKKQFSNRDKEFWNLIGSYEKVGEMIVWNGYWVEEYQDTLTNYRKLLFVQKDKHNTISDSLNLGILKDKESVHYGTVELNEKEDREIVALFVQDDSLYHQKILRAWKANTETGKFEVFPVTGIRVKNARLHYR